MRPDVQQVAADALGTREGSVVVMDPHTGAIIAMVSNPRYNPADVAVHDSKQAEAVLTYLNAQPGKPLLANAYQERYMPGSSFKVITTSIAFENGATTLDRVFPVSKSWLPPQTTDPIQNYGGEVCGGTMVEVFYRSCNIPFAQLATELGPQKMVDGTKKWGIGEKVPIDLPAPAASFFGEVSDFTDQLPLLAIGGFGQGSTTMVPLHMAMVASTIANGGVMMKPHVIDATLDHDGGVLSRTTPSVWKTPILPATADTLTALMIGVVNQGTGQTDAARRWDPSCGQDRHGAVEHHRPGAIQRVDHRFRPGDGSAVRDCRGVEGWSQRRDQCQHRRKAGRTDRQTGARLPVRPSGAGRRVTDRDVRSAGSYRYPRGALDAQESSVGST